MSIKNIGNFRAKVTSIRIGYEIGKNIPDFFVKNNKNSLVGNVFVTKETPIYFPTANSFSVFITHGMLDSIRQPGAVLFLETYIEYENPVNDKKGNASTIIRIDYKKEGARTSYILNDSEEEK